MKRKVGSLDHFRNAETRNAPRIPKWSSTIPRLPVLPWRALNCTVHPEFSARHSSTGKMIPRSSRQFKINMVLYIQYNLGSRHRDESCREGRDLLGAICRSSHVGNPQPLVLRTARCKSETDEATMAEKTPFPFQSRIPKIPSSDGRSRSS
jgi:hypothetical protein